MTKYRIFLPFLFVLFYLNAVSQSFVNPLNKWYADDCCYDFMGEQSCITYSYWLGAPMVFDTFTYLQLFSDNPYLESGKYYRESEGRVFMKPDAFSDEFLIYDFNASTGEQIQIGPPSDQFSVIVGNIDTVMLASGEKRKRMEIRSEPDPRNTYWIEGVGSLLSPMDTRYMFLFDCWVELNCFFIDNTEQYTIGDCMLTNTRLQNSAADAFRVFPNPAGNTIEIFSPASDFVQSVELKNIDGQTVFALKKSGMDRIDISQLPPGFYFIFVKYVSGKTASAKVVKTTG